MKKREKIMNLKTILSKYEHYLNFMVISQEKNEYNTGWNNALTHIIQEIKRECEL